ncbi:MAG: hypothetical protein HQ462_07170 [Deltaproteobacteria bacterium]|nr:hypothetical protein [Deltaproteobacteria bacterium]
MKSCVWGFLFLFSHLIFALPNDTPSEVTENPIPEFTKIIIGLDLELLIPDNLSGLSLPQTLTGPKLGIALGADSLMLGAFYNSNAETSNLILSELDYRFNLSTPFITGYALAGLHYLHFRLAFKDKDYVGPVVGFGFDLPMARTFKMGLRMKLYYPLKTMLSFGGGFSFLF